MPPRNLRHFDINFGGGWSTERGSNFGVGGAAITVPFFINAENGVYHMDGGFEKMPGTVKLNTTSISESSVVQSVMGLYEYIRFGTSGIETRKRMCHAGTRIMKEDLDGVWDELFTGLESGRIPHYATFDDLLIMSSTSSVDVPRSWDQTTAQNLAGSPPNFAKSASHKNRQWAIDVDSNPSGLYYSVSLDPEDWTGAGSGSIDIDPNDGDKNMAVFSHKNDLWVLKGPYHGSIHRITGSAPTGSDAFARIPFIKGVGASNQSCVFKFGDDMGWMGIQGQIHSLSATASFGDFNQAFLSASIYSYIRQSLNHQRLEFAWAATHPDKGQVLIVATRAGALQNNVGLLMDYRFSPVRWSLWPLPRNCASVAMMMDVNQVQRPYYGHYDGFVRQGDHPNRSWDGTAISYRLTLPSLNFGSSDFLKTLYTGRLSVVPTGIHTATFQWLRDNAAAQTAAVSQGGQDFLGTAADNQFVLGTSRLAGAGFATQAFDMTGEFRDVQFEVTNSTDNQNVNLHGLGVSMTGGPPTTEAPGVA